MQWLSSRSRVSGIADSTGPSVREDQQVQISVSPIGEQLVKIVLSGRLDTQGAERVETSFTAALVPGGNNAVVDLSQVEFVTSMGIRMFVAVARSLKMRQARMALFGAQEQCAQVFEAVSLNKIIPIRITEAEALEAVSAPQS